MAMHALALVALLALAGATFADNPTMGPYSAPVATVPAPAATVPAPAAQTMDDAKRAATAKPEAAKLAEPVTAENICRASEKVREAQLKICRLSVVASSTDKKCRALTTCVPITSPKPTEGNPAGNNPRPALKEPKGVEQPTAVAVVQPLPSIGAYADEGANYPDEGARALAAQEVKKPLDTFKTAAVAPTKQPAKVAQPTLPADIGSIAPQKALTTPDGTPIERASATPTKTPKPEKDITFHDIVRKSMEREEKIIEAEARKDMAYVTNRAITDADKVDTALKTLQDPEVMSATARLCEQAVTGNCRITSRFGYRPKVEGVPGASRYHGGIDFGPKIRQTKGDRVFSSMDGIVKKVGPNAGYGNVVEVCNGQLCSFYGHLDSTANLVPGSKVKAGEQLGKMGNTGLSGMHPHLHYEVSINSIKVDPAKAETLTLIRAARGNIVPTQVMTAGNIPSVELRTTKPSNTRQPTTQRQIVYTPQGVVQQVASVPLQNWQPMGSTADGQGGMQQSGGQGGLMGMFSSLFGGGQGGGGQGSSGDMGGGQGGTGQDFAGMGSSPLPVVYLTPEQFTAVLQTGALPNNLTAAQNKALPTDCTNQATGAAANLLLRPACRTPEADVGIGSGDVV